MNTANKVRLDHEWFHRANTRCQGDDSDDERHASYNQGPAYSQGGGYGQGPGYNQGQMYQDPAMAPGTGQPLPDETASGGSVSSSDRESLEEAREEYEEAYADAYDD